MLRQPTATSDQTEIRYPNTGFLVKAGMMSHVMPSAGRMSTYTSGWPRNQNRCCHNSGDPPVFGSSWLPTTSPDGRKKLVPRCRSRSSITAAAVSGGNASRPRIDAMKYDHTVSGNRIIDMPCARTLSTVATMLRPLIVKDAMKSAMLSSQIDCPSCDPGTAGGDRAERRVCRPAGCGRATRHEERRDEHERRQQGDPVRQHVQERERHVSCADLERHEVVPESADEHVRDEKKHHDRAVHRHDSEIELRRHDATHVSGRQQPGEQRPLMFRPAELKPDERC